MCIRALRSNGSFCVGTQAYLRGNGERRFELGSKEPTSQNRDVGHPATAAVPTDFWGASWELLRFFAFGSE
jgi:hypothetical protein